MYRKMRKQTVGKKEIMNQRLRVSDNRRFLQHENGEPFFYLGDTAWEIFHRLTRDEADFYLETRAAQGFNVIQAVVLPEIDGLRVPNREGHLPLIDNDPTQPNEAYFQLVDYVIDKTASLGMFVGLLPTWGDKWNTAWGSPFSSGTIFTSENAAIYGEFIGRRYADKPVIWILGGDRPVENDDHRAIINAMAEGLGRGDGGAHLQTFHPMGGKTSSENFHDADWLDFNMWQTGHASPDLESADAIAGDYNLTPTKPCMDSEPRYEDHPIMGMPWNWNGKDWFSTQDIRTAAYHAVFAGACGHTYGCHDVWQMLDETREPINHARTPWREAIHLPAASQMQHVRALIESRPYFSRIPDDTLILSDANAGRHRVVATRDTDSSYALVYIPSGQATTIDCSRLSGENLVASWFDPRNGELQEFETFAREESKTFAPPTNEDWVLVLDAR